MTSIGKKSSTKFQAQCFLWSGEELRSARTQKSEPSRSNKRGIRSIFISHTPLLPVLVWYYISAANKFSQIQACNLTQFWPPMLCSLNVTIPASVGYNFKGFLHPLLWNKIPVLQEYKVNLLGRSFPNLSTKKKMDVWAFEIKPNSPSI